MLEHTWICEYCGIETQSLDLLYRHKEKCRNRQINWSMKRWKL